MNTVELLTKTRDLLSQPYKHTRGYMHAKKKTKRGEIVDCFCAVGGLRHMAGASPDSVDGHKFQMSDADKEAYAKALTALNRAVEPDVYRTPLNSHTYTVTSFNDSRPKKEVMALFDKAIKIAEKEGL